MKARLKVGAGQVGTRDLYIKSSLSGEWKKIGGVDAYVATPSGDYSKDKVILFLTDVFGPQVINARVRLLFGGFLSFP